ncbi:SMC-Scp complex subunit ScpB [Candidatus Epulonipiscium viviparus]|uniref:SMC-Scp complex subunit ScpB n=1 Tax=Candidatus Epulonipiscium viviparus TaxID=420336 RepID=UPI00273809C8|nr:SMC-Scp complex subunit ScpB [Candidatus Epulopiscium viviparus]
MKLTDLESNIEALLFFVGDVVRTKKLCELFEISSAEITAAIQNLNHTYAISERGLEIIELDAGFQMCTAPKNMNIILKYKKWAKRSLLTKTMLETLAIIAYKQPITRPQIENIRGIKSDVAVSKLIEYGLVEEAGRLAVIGRPILLATTTEFLRHFNFTSLDDLPKVQESLITQFAAEVQAEVGSIE